MHVQRSWGRSPLWTRMELFNAATDGKRIYAGFLERAGDLRIAEVTRAGS